MTIQSIKGHVLIPDPPIGHSAATGHGALLIDAASEKVAGIFRIHKTGTINTVIWRSGTVTTGANIDVRLETVDPATGDPTGTLVGTNTSAVQAVNATDDNIFFTTTLTAGASVTKGDLVALVIAQPSSSFGSMNVATNPDNSIGFPYSDLYTTSWAKTASTLIAGLGYNDGSFEPIAGQWCASFTTTAFNSGSTPDERGIIFQLPFPALITGAWVWIDGDGDFDVVLYDTDGSTVLGTCSQDKDVRSSIAADIFLLEFPSEYAIKAGANYRLSVKPTSATNATLQEFTVPTAAALDAMTGGQSIHLTTRTDGGSWSQTTTQRPLMGVIASGFDGGGRGGRARRPISASSSGE